MGNICRSPTAEAVFRHMVRKKDLEHIIYIDSSGTHGYHAGDPPDHRSQKVARMRGINMSTLKARQFRPRDFRQFDYIVVMDRQNRHELLQMADLQYRDKISLMMSHAAGADYGEVPDPYYGNNDGFELVLDLLQQASDGLLEFIIKKHHLH